MGGDEGEGGLNLDLMGFVHPSPSQRPSEPAATLTLPRQRGREYLGKFQICLDRFKILNRQSSLFNPESEICFLQLEAPITFAKVAPAGDDLMIHQEFDHLTLIVALVAFEPASRTGFLEKIESPEPRSGRFRPLHQFGSPDRTHDIEMLRDDQGRLQLFFNGLSDASVGRHAPLKDNG